jgi:hypothetical protein
MRRFEVITISRRVIGERLDLDVFNWNCHYNFAETASSKQVQTPADQPPQSNERFEPHGKVWNG